MRVIDMVRALYHGRSYSSINLFAYRAPTLFLINLRDLAHVIPWPLMRAGVTSRESRESPVKGVQGSTYLRHSGHNWYGTHACQSR